MNDGVEYVAFLRGINVGGRSVVKMEDLRKTLESMGFKGVKTVMASGNVRFRAEEKDVAALSMHLARGLKEAFGRDIFVIVRPLDDIRELVARRPFQAVKDAPGARLFVTFFSGSADNCAFFPAGEDGYRILSVADGAICSVLYEKPGIGAVELMGAIEKAFGQKVTTRSWSTIEKLLK